MFQKHKRSPTAGAPPPATSSASGPGGVEDDAAVVDEDHPRRELERASDPVLREHDRRSEALDGFEEERSGVRVELGGRLVEQQQLRLERERRGEADPL